MSDSDSSMEWEQGAQRREEEDWDDWEEEGEEDQTRSLFAETVLASPQEAIEHDKATFGFDLRAFVREQSLGEYDVIKVVTAIRRAVAGGVAPAQVVAGLGGRSWDTEENLMPVDPADPLLFFDVGTTDFEKGAQRAEPEGPAAPAAAVTAEDTIQALRDENEALREALEQLKGSSEIAREIATGAASGEEAGPSSAAQTVKEKVEKAYFGSYSTFGIHREMLADRVRTEAYRVALEENPSLIRGATVLDVGCGTGVLSMFAARGGAGRVVGVDGSKEIAAFAQRNVEANGLAAAQGGPVSIVSGVVEDLCRQDELVPGVGQVDVVVSEWMGYALLFETMLPSVFAARDRFLRPGGAMLPDRAVMYLALGGEGSSGLGFWDRVYGLDMRPVRDHLAEDARKAGIVKEVPGGEVLSDPAVVRDLDLCTATRADLSFNSPFALRTRGDCAGREVHSLVLWFETPFSERFCKDRPTTLPTGPDTTATHWVQTVFLLRQPVTLAEGEALEGVISYADAKEHRALDIGITCHVSDGQGGQRCAQSNVYNMSVV